MPPYAARDDPEQEQIMKRWIRSIGRAQGAPRPDAKTSLPATSCPVLAPEALEGRVLMAAQLNSSLLVNKFAGSATGAPTTSTPAAVVGPTAGLKENDDRISKAAKKGLDFTVNSSISEPRDVDMFKFSVSKNQRVEFDIDRPFGTRLDSILRVFDGSGRELAMNDDGAAEFEDEATTVGESAIDYTFRTAGTYYVGVSGTGNDHYNAVTGFGDVNADSIGKYTLTVSKLPPPDANDQLSEAELVSIGDFITAKIDRGDVDMFKFEAHEGQTIAFDIEQDAILGAGDTILRLFDADGNELAFNDDGQAPDEDGQLDLFGESYIEYTFEADGIYYIAVSGGRTTGSISDTGNSGYDPTTGEGDKPGSTGRYALRILDAADFAF